MTTMPRITTKTSPADAAAIKLHQYGKGAPGDIALCIKYSPKREPFYNEVLELVEKELTQNPELNVGEYPLPEAPVDVPVSDTKPKQTDVIVGNDEVDVYDDGEAEVLEIKWTPYNFAKDGITVNGVEVGHFETGPGVCAVVLRGDGDIDETVATFDKNDDKKPIAAAKRWVKAELNRVGSVKALVDGYHEALKVAKASA